VTVFTPYKGGTSRRLDLGKIFLVILCGFLLLQNPPLAARPEANADKLVLQLGEPDQMGSALDAFYATPVCTTEV